MTVPSIPLAVLDTARLSEVLKQKNKNVVFRAAAIRVALVCLTFIQTFDVAGGRIFTRTEDSIVIGF